MNVCVLILLINFFDKLSCNFIILKIIGKYNVLIVNGKVLIDIKFIIIVVINNWI